MSTDGELTTPADGTASPSSPVPEAFSPAGYADLVEIGRGGFGVVYRARHQALGRVVALKVLTPLLTSDVRDRFEREQRIMAELSHHPNIVTLYAAGVTPSGHSFIELEYLPNGSLAEQLKDGQVTLSSAIHHTVRLCGAVEVCHREGVLHRDIKLQNVLLSRYGEPKLTDFGVARVLLPDATSTATLPLTLAYAAPELLSGEAPASAASDVYSLAASLFALLTGQPPFGSQGNSDARALIARVLTGTVPELGRDVPREVADVVRWGLTRDPVQRPASALVFGEELRRAARQCGLVPPEMVVDALTTPRGTARGSELTGPPGEQTVRLTGHPAEAENEGAASKVAPTEVVITVSDAGDESSTRRDVLVRASGSVTCAELAVKLGRPRAQMHTVRGPLSPDARVTTALLHGDVLRLDGVRETGVQSGPSLTIVGGQPGGGRSFPIGEALVVGRSRQADAVIEDRDVSRRHVSIRREGPAFVLEDLASMNGTTVDGRPATGPTAVRPGQMLQIGETVATMVAEPIEPAVTGPGDRPGHLAVNRPPRLRLRQQHEPLCRPARPRSPEGLRFPIATLLLPLVIGVVIAYIQHSPIYLLLAAASPLMMLGNAISDRRSGRRKHRTESRAFERAMAQFNADVTARVQQSESARRTQFASPAELAVVACVPGQRLWERRPDDDDFGVLRLGLADRPSSVEIRSDEPDDPLVDRLVPVVVSLSAAGVVGIAGPRSAAEDLARAVVAHASVLHSPADLSLAVLSAPSQPDNWSWAAWLPHAESPSSWLQRRLATTPGERAALLGELVALITAREEQRRQSMSAASVEPAIIVLIDGAHSLRSLPNLTEVLRRGPAARVWAICLETDPAQLPAECRAVATFSDGQPSRLDVHLQDGERITDVLADGLAPELAEQVARGLAPLRDLGHRGTRENAVPTDVGLLALHGVSSPTASWVSDQWARSADGRSTAVVLGASADGPFTIDLRRDGPHVLVAGTTGSGKSELLQSLVTSLALANRPDAMSFVLIDYKGGATVAELARLPHTVGVVTDLDEHLADRALISLTSELKRREQLFADAGARDIEQYWRTEKSSPLPRLLIAIDEFASLVEEIPDFVKGIVGIGMRGRSLGVHLVLATQRPAGVVSAEIRANVNLRLCLRVANTAESQDVLDRPDAADISPAIPGRALSRVGSGPLHTFQAARVSGRSARSSTPSTPLVLTPLTRGFGRSAAETSTPAASPADDDKADSDLSLIVSAVVAAAGRVHAAPPGSPWLPPLADLVRLDALPSPADATPASAVVGLLDRPADQAQVPLLIDLEATGGILVAGSARSGRSTVLRTVAGGLAAHNAVDELHLYAIDASGQGLRPLAVLPHCGGVIAGSETETTERLVSFLSATVTARQETLARARATTLAEYRRSLQPTERPPYIVLLIDGYEEILATYTEHDGGRVIDELLRLVRVGPSVGVITVVTTDRGGLAQKLLGALSHRLVLRMADADDFWIIGLSRRQVPTQMPPGRAFWAQGNEDPSEVQVAVLGEDGSGAGQAAALARIARAAEDGVAEIPSSRRPRPMVPLPRRITMEEVERLRDEPPPTAPAVATVGIGGDLMGVLDVDLVEAGYAFVVAGPPRSGKSTALLALAVSLLSRDRPYRLIAVTPRRSLLHGLADHRGVTVVTPDGLPTLLTGSDEPIIFVIDDAEHLTDAASTAILEHIVRMSRDSGNLLLIAGGIDDLRNAYRGWISEARRARTGLLLRPNSPVDGEVLNVRLPRNLPPHMPPGRGFLVVSGLLTVAQVADPG